MHKQWVTPPPKQDPNPLDKCGTFFSYVVELFVLSRVTSLPYLCSFCKIKLQWVILLSPGSLEVVKGGSRIRLHCGVQVKGVRGSGGSVGGAVPFSLPVVHFQVLHVTYGHVTTKISCGAPLKERTAFPNQSNSQTQSSTRSQNGQ